MKPQPFTWPSFQTRLSRYFLVWLAATLVSCEKCEIYPRPKGKTVIFGYVSDDQTKQMIEGVEIVLTGNRFLLPPFRMKSYFTNKEGYYEIILDTPPDSARSLQVAPSLLSDPRFYSRYIYYRANARTCCYAPIGQHTEYNFALIPRP